MALPPLPRADNVNRRSGGKREGVDYDIGVVGDTNSPLALVGLRRAHKGRRGRGYQTRPFFMPYAPSLRENLFGK